MLPYSERLPSGEKWEMHTRSEKDEEEFLSDRRKIKRRPQKQHLET